MPESNFKYSKDNYHNIQMALYRVAMSNMYIKKAC